MAATIADLQAACDAAQTAQQAASDAVAHRDQTIRQAHDAGIPVATIVRISGITRGRVYQILDAK